MGTKESRPLRRRYESSSSEASSNGPPSQTILPPPQFPTTTTLPEPQLPVTVLSTSSLPDHPPNLLSISTPDSVTAPYIPDDVTVPHSPNAILASPIPEIYYSNDMIHIDSPEPALPVDPSIPSYVSVAGEVSQAYPEPDPYITNYVELYGIPPAPPLSDPNGIRDPNFRDSFVTINGFKLAQPRKKNWDMPTRDEFVYSFSYQTNNWF